MIYNPKNTKYTSALEGQQRDARQTEEYAKCALFYWMIDTSSPSPERARWEFKKTMSATVDKYCANRYY